MNQRDDLGSRTPGDWLAFVKQGEDWGFPACYGQGGTVCKGVPSPVGVLDPHAAAGGVAILTSQLGGRYRSSALVAEWEHGKVLRVALKRTATGYRGSVSTFLTGLQNPLPVATTAGRRRCSSATGAAAIIYRISSSKLTESRILGRRAEELARAQVPSSATRAGSASPGSAASRGRHPTVGRASCRRCP